MHINGLVGNYQLFLKQKIYADFYSYSKNLNSSLLSSRKVQPQIYTQNMRLLDMITCLLKGKYKRPLFMAGLE